MTKWFIIIMAFALVSVSFAIPQSAAACSCAELLSPAKALDRATAVFSGMVVSLEGPTGNIISSADPVTVVLQADKVWKGAKQSNITITTALDSASCGYEFQIGQWYLVYANGAHDDLQVDLCSGTKQLFQADEDLEFLGDGHAIFGDQNTNNTSAGDKEAISCDNDDGFNYTALITLVAGTLIGAVGGVVLTKRRYVFKG